MTEFGACAGIEVTASHNPINYNGIKIVKLGSQSLDDTSDFQLIKLLAESADWRFNRRKPNTKPLVRLNVETSGDAGGIEANIARISEKMSG